MQKKCFDCLQERDAEKDFNWKYKDRGIRNSRCKFCQSQVSKQHYENNKQDYMDRNLVRNPRIREDNQQRIAAYLANHPCIDCGKTDMRVLEFDHVCGKKSGNISKMVQTCYSWPTIEAEIAKCEVRRVNCHRIKTSERGGFWRNLSNNV